MTTHETMIKNILDAITTSYTISTSTTQPPSPSITVSFLQPSNPHYASMDEHFRIQIKDTAANLDAIIKLIKQQDSRYPNGFKGYYGSDPYYTYETETDDTTPSSITNVSADLDVLVKSDIDGRTKVLGVYNDTLATYGTFQFVSFTASKTEYKVEFWMKLSLDNVLFYLFGDTIDPSKPLALFRYTLGFVEGVDEPQIYYELYNDVNMVNGHIAYEGDWVRMRFEFTATSSSLYVDNVLQLTNSSFIGIPTTKMYIGVEQLVDDNALSYFDSFDFDWAPYYYVNRLELGYHFFTDYPYYLTVENIDKWDNQADLLIKARWAV